MNAEHVGRGPLVVDLAGTGTLSASEIGAKAHNLALLARDGFPVPAGLVVTPDAAERWEEARPRLLEAAPDLEAARFAVRSSGTAEDLEGASFAGQYETVLGAVASGWLATLRRDEEFVVVLFTAAQTNPEVGAAWQGLIREGTELLTG